MIKEEDIYAFFTKENALAVTNSSKPPAGHEYVIQNVYQGISDKPVGYLIATKQIENPCLQILKDSIALFELNQWVAKTDWVQETAKPGELGMHRADAMKQRIDNLQALNTELLNALKDLFADYKSLADSGDCGNWSLEEYPEGKAAIAVMQKVESA
jgi:hypothetical protein